MNFNISFYLNYKYDTSILCIPTQEIQDQYNERFNLLSQLDIPSIVELNPGFGYNIPLLMALRSINYLALDPNPFITLKIMEHGFNSDHDILKFQDFQESTTSTLPTLPIDLAIVNNPTLHSLHLAYKCATYILVTNTHKELIRNVLINFLMTHDYLNLIETPYDTLIQLTTNKVFSIGGDQGDIWASLPLLKFASLHCPQDSYPLNLISRPYTREKMDETKVNNIKGLLLKQDYISEVNFKEDINAIELDIWRNNAKWSKSIPDSFCEAFNAPTNLHDSKWLNADKLTISYVIFARSPRFHTSNIMWKKLYKLYPNAVFVGLPEEHKNMVKLIGDIPYHPTENFEQLASVINGATLVCCNQSAPYWISAALQKNTILEIDMRFNNCRVNQPNVIYVQDENAIILDKPELIRFW